MSVSRAGAPRRRRLLRLTGTAIVGVGVLVLAWTILVWRWQDPFTALYTWHEQRQLRSQLNTLMATYPKRAPAAAAAAERASARRATAAARAAETAARQQAVAAEIRGEAARFRASVHTGQAIGRLRIPRIGIDFVLVDGTDEHSLEKGPGRDPRSYMPGQDRLVYIAGHRTTYLAPFANINDLRRGDRIYLTMPYASFVYRVTGHVIVPATDLAVLHSGTTERLALQACHPRFFATHRYIVWASLVRETPARQPAAARPASSRQASPAPGSRS